MSKRTPLKDISKKYSYNSIENTKNQFDSPQEKLLTPQKQHSRNF